MKAGNDHGKNKSSETGGREWLGQPELETGTRRLGGQQRRDMGGSSGVLEV